MENLVANDGRVIYYKVVDKYSEKPMVRKGVEKIGRYIHYYVIMNPNADLTVVKDYVIAPITSVNNVGDEVAQEGGTASNGDETVTVTTKHRS